MAKRRANEVQRAVLQSRARLILREDSLSAEVDRLLRPLLSEWERVIRTTLSRRARTLTAAELAEALRRTATMRKLGAVTDQYIAAVERAARSSAAAVLRSDAYQAAFAMDATLSGGFGGLSRSAALAASRSVLPGRTLTVGFRSLSASALVSMRRDLTRAVADGWNLEDLVSKWSGGSGAGRVLRDAESLALTAMMTASNEGQVAVWRAQGVRFLRWEATFDARTCPHCGGRHGKVYDIDKLPAMPAHLRCRCVWIPVFGDARDRALARPRPFPRPSPSALLGQTRSYEAWLRKQPAGTQRDVLGSELKYQSWRRRELSLEELTHEDARPLRDEDVLARLGRPAPAPAPVLEPHPNVQAVPVIKGRTNRELAESFSGPKPAGAYEGATIGEGIRARMAREMRASLKAAQVKDLAAAEAEASRIATAMDDLYAKAAGRTLTPAEEAISQKLSDELDNMIRERELAAGGVPATMQGKFHQLVRLPGNARGLQIQTYADAEGEVSQESMADVRGRIRVTTDLISKRVSRRPFYKWPSGKEDAYGLVRTVVHPGPYRPNYAYDSRTMRVGVDTPYRTIAHELGHHLEASDMRVRDAAVKYLERRTAGEAARRMTELRPGLNYESHEMARPDKFMDPYWGKDYRRHSTEIVSMGLEYVVEEPWTLARQDPETFDFVMAVLRGDYDEMERIAYGAGADLPG